MRTLSVIIRTVAFFTLLGAVGCTSPLTTGTSAVVATLGPLGAHSARIVLQFPGSRGVLHSLSDVGFVTVRLQSEDRQTTLFAEAPKTGGSFVVDFAGLVAGQWSMRTLLYDSASSLNLLFYAQQTETIEVGSVTTATVEAYEVGTIGGVSPGNALLPDSIELTDANGVSVSGAVRILTVGHSLALHPLVNSNVSGAPASDGRVTWESTNTQVATVSSSGRVVAEGEGTVAILARSVANPAVVGSFYLAVTPALVGLWLTDGAPGGVSVDAPPAVKDSVAQSRGSPVHKTLVRFATNGVMTTYTISTGTFGATRGAYTTSGDWLASSATEYFGAYSGLWSSMAPTASGKRYSIALDTLQMTNANGSVQLYSRVDEVPLDGAGTNYPASLFLGERFTPTVILTPAAPTFPQVLWTSTVPSVASIDAYTGEVRALSTGTFGVVGTSLGSGLVVASATVAVTVPVLAGYFVGSSSRSTFFLDSLGELTATGQNASGELGTGLPVPQEKVAPVSVMTGVASVSLGHFFTMVLKTNGDLWATGENGLGQLGTGDTVGQTTPVFVMGGVSQVAAGGQFTMILKSDGTLWATGDNTNGQLGDGTTTNQLSPVQVMSGVAAVSASTSSTLVVKTDGSLWAMGYNGNGELGIGSTTDTSVPVQVMTGVRSVSQGLGHTLIVTTDDKLYATGYNNEGELGAGDNGTRTSPTFIVGGVSSASAGASHSLVVMTDSSLWAMGYNGDGSLGTGDNMDRWSPVQVTSGVSTAAAGLAHSLFLKTDGSLWAMGSSEYGQFGNGTQDGSPTPTPLTWWVRATPVGNPK